MAQRGLRPDRLRGEGEAPRIALCLGDPAGVGYEVGLDAIAKLVRTRLPRDCGIMVIGNAGAVADACRLLERKPLLKTITSPMVPAPGQTLLLDTGNGGSAGVESGKPNASAGKMTMAALERAADCARYGFVDAIVYTAIDTRSLVAGGSNTTDVGDFFAGRFGAEGPRMDVVLAGHRKCRLWVGRVGPPAAPADVAHLITREKVVAALVLLRDLMMGAGLRDARIALPSLSSHAQMPDCGCPLVKEVLEPAVGDARALGVEVTGPLAADTVFKSAFAGGYNGVLSLYHDQGMIAVKTVAFESAVLLHAGLPIPVVTTAHGSALDIAGKGVASSAATIEAIWLATELAMGAARAGCGNGAEADPRSASVSGRS